MTTRLEVDLSLGLEAEGLPTEDDFTRWAATVLPPGHWNLSIRLVDAEEGQALNAQYRHKDYPTNVLSFPAELPDGVELPLLGDLVLCVPVVEREAAEQGKPLLHHWAHLTIHGVLHLLGHDHLQEDEAAAMEALEVQALARLGIPDPYESDGCL